MSDAPKRFTCTDYCPAAELNAELEAENARLKIKLESVYEAGLSGISYVGASNYASRERDAKQRLRESMATEAGDE